MEFCRILYIYLEFNSNVFDVIKNQNGVTSYKNI